MSLLSSFLFKSATHVNANSHSVARIGKQTSKTPNGTNEDLGHANNSLNFKIDCTSNVPNKVEQDTASFF